MIGIIATGHGKFASGISSSLEMFFGKTNGYFYVDFDEGMPLEDFKKSVYEKIEVLNAECQQIIIITDLFAGTPFNQCMELTFEFNNVNVITGLSLPILMEAMVMRDNEITVEEFISSLKEVYIKSFIHGNEMLNK